MVFPATMPTMSSIRADEMANLKEMKLEISAKVNQIKD
jgi:hypothetical protein